MHPDSTSEFGKLVDDQSAPFASLFNARSFTFRHSLHESTLFDISELADLAHRMMARGGGVKFVAFKCSDSSVGTKFNTLQRQDSLSEVVRRIGEGGSWLRLSQMQDLDDRYARLLRQVIGELGEAADVPLAREITFSSMTVFIASPFVDTPFHVDHESNFLFQVRGAKDICLFDQNDRAVVPEEELERFYMGDRGAATYRPALQDRGTVYRLEPGTAVHHPPLAPHWVKNADNVSVSVSFAFGMRSIDRQAKIRQANLCLRQMGLRPRSPGTSERADHIKASALEIISKSKPKDREDLLFSGINRIKAPMKLARRALGRAPS